MAREFENLEILISVLNERAIQNINELIRRIETLNQASKKVRRIRIKVNVADRELDQLLAKMGAAQAGGAAGVDVSPGEAAAGQAAELQQIGISQRGRLIQLAQARNNQLKSIDRSLSVLVAQGARQIQAGAGAGGPAGFRRGQLEEVGHAFADASFAHLRGVQDPMARGRPGEITTRQSIFNLKMRDINNALAKFLPLMLVFQGSMPAAIAGMLGLAAAAATAAGALVSLAGLGFLGIVGQRAGGAPDFDAFQDVMEDIRDMFLDAFMPLANRLVPFMTRALDGLGMLFEDVARAMHGILDMRQDARAFGRWIQRNLPEMIEQLLEMSMAFMPIFRAVGRFIEQTDLVHALADATEAVLPQLAALVQELIIAAPLILGISQGMLKVTTNIAQLLGVFTRLFNIIPGGAEVMGQMIGIMMTTFTVIAVFNALVTFRLIPAIASWGAWGLKQAGAALVAVGALKAETVAKFIATAATWKLVIAAIALVSIVTLGIGAILGITGALIGSATAADQASKALGDFNSELDDTADQMSPYRGPDQAPRAVDEAAASRANGRNGGGNITNNFHGDTDPDDFDTKMNNTIFKMR